MHVGPCVKSLAVEDQLTDIYARRKMINIEKLTYPYRENKKESSSKIKYRTLMNKTTRNNSKSEYDNLNRKNTMQVDE